MVRIERLRRLIVGERLGPTLVEYQHGAPLAQWMCVMWGQPMSERELRHGIVDAPEHAITAPAAKRGIRAAWLEPQDVGEIVKRLVVAAEVIKGPAPQAQRLD